jgi:TetR/AcrR family transcriptional regulator, transcriptional repressor for nem operon
VRYAKGHKDATHEQILDVASKRFRREGIEAVGIASLMADVGLTHGGFYSHFSSKEDLARQAIAFALDSGRQELTRAAGHKPGFESIVRTYLDPRHRDRPDRGCAAAAVGSELARHPAQTRAAIADEIQATIDLMASHLPGGDAESNRQRAAVIFALMMGALQLARLTKNRVRSDRILADAAEAAIRMAREA